LIGLVEPREHILQDMRVNRRVLWKRETETRTRCQAVMRCSNPVL
jgi:hypothetical protein